MPHSQGLSNNPYPEPNQPNLSFDTYFLKIHPSVSVFNQKAADIISMNFTRTYSKVTQFIEETS